LRALRTLNNGASGEWYGRCAHCWTVRVNTSEQRRIPRVITNYSSCITRPGRRGVLLPWVRQRWVVCRERCRAYQGVSTRDGAVQKYDENIESIRFSFQNII